MPFSVAAVRVSPWWDLLWEGKAAIKSTGLRVEAGLQGVGAVAAYDRDELAELGRAKKGVYFWRSCGREVPSWLTATQGRGRGSPGSLLCWDREGQRLGLEKSMPKGHLGKKQHIIPQVLGEPKYITACLEWGLTTGPKFMSHLQRNSSYLGYTDALTCIRHCLYSEDGVPQALRAQALESSRVGFKS